MSWLEIEVVGEPKMTRTGEHQEEKIPENPQTGNHSVIIKEDDLKSAEESPAFVPTESGDEENMRSSNDDTQPLI